MRNLSQVLAVDNIDEWLETTWMQRPPIGGTGQKSGPRRGVELGSSTAHARTKPIGRAGAIRDAATNVSEPLSASDVIVMPQISTAVRTLFQTKKLSDKFILSSKFVLDMPFLVNFPENRERLSSRLQTFQYELLLLLMRTIDTIYNGNSPKLSEEVRFESIHELYWSF